MKLKIFKVNDYEWVAATNMEEAIQCLMNTCGVSREDAYDESVAHEVSVKDANRLKFFDDNYKEPLTFMQELHKRYKDGEKFPQVFAVSEW